MLEALAIGLDAREFRPGREPPAQFGPAVTARSRVEAKGHPLSRLRSKVIPAPGLEPVPAERVLHDKGAPRPADLQRCPRFEDDSRQGYARPCCAFGGKAAAVAVIEGD